MDAFQILVIILAVFLAIFLILGIILLIMLIRLSIKIRRIAETVGETTENIKQFFENMRRIVSPAIIVQIIVKWIRNIIKKKGNNNE